MYLGVINMVHKFIKLAYKESVLSKYPTAARVAL